VSDGDVITSPYEKTPPRLILLCTVQPYAFRRNVAEETMSAETTRNVGRDRKLSQQFRFGRRPRARLVDAAPDPVDQLESDPM
jgi:hypothetical protein